MGKIKELSKELLPKIAAGEVVEGPSSVIKELIENSIDSGASEITVEIENNGLNKIRVLDNGSGMDKDDLLKSFLPHTTSKIYSMDDLFHIATLGFRGEALSSIAAVSDMTIRSKAINEVAGSEVVLKAGKLVKNSVIGCPIGTLVEVENLFFNVPARKKFLKSGQNEYGKILNLITTYNMLHNKININFYRDGKNVLVFNKEIRYNEKLASLLGTHLFKGLFKFKARDSHINMKGFLSKPQVAGYHQSDQYLFVNDRAVSSKVIKKAIKDAYGHLIEEKAIPPFILFLDLSHDLVDVNIHPRKEEIRFWNEQEIYSFIYESLVKELQKNNLIYVKGDYLSGRNASKHEFYLLKDSQVDWNLKRYKNNVDNEEIVQINNTYLMSNIQGGILLIDQHAAHESILYEEYLKIFNKENLKGKILELDLPMVISLSVKQSNDLKNHMQTLNMAGFNIEEFGVNTFRITHIPSLFKNHDIKNLIAELLEEYTNGSRQNSKIDERSKKTIEFLACRSAVKAGDFLTLEERKELLEKLNKSNNIYTCPHGRPVKIIITLRELEKMFKRIK